VPELEQRGHEVFGCDISHNEDDWHHFKRLAITCGATLVINRHVERVVG